MRSAESSPPNTPSSYFKIFFKGYEVTIDCCAALNLAIIVALQLEISASVRQLKNQNLLSGSHQLSTKRPQL